MLQAKELVNVHYTRTWTGNVPERKKLPTLYVLPSSSHIWKLQLNHKGCDNILSGQVTAHVKGWWWARCSNRVVISVGRQRTSERTCSGATVCCLWRRCPERTLHAVDCRHDKRHPGGCSGLIEVLTLHIPAAAEYKSRVSPVHLLPLHQPRDVT